MTNLSTPSSFLQLFPPIGSGWLTSLQFGPLLRLESRSRVGWKCPALKCWWPFYSQLQALLRSQEAACLKARAGGQDARVLPPDPHSDLEKVKCHAWLVICITYEIRSFTQNAINISGLDSSESPTLKRGKALARRAFWGTILWERGQHFEVTRGKVYTH